MEKPKVSIIILNWNGWKDTLECVESLLKISYPNYEILIVDNGSTNESVKVLSQRFPDIEIIETGKNLGFCGGNNVGIKRAIEKGTDYIFVMNNDIVVDKNFLNPLVEAMERDKRIGISCGTVYYYDKPNLIHQMGNYVSLYTGNTYALGIDTVDKGQFKEQKIVPECPAGAMLVRRELFEKIGVFNEKFFIYSEEPDIAFRARKAGYELVFVPGSKVYHKIGRDASRQPKTGFYSLRNRIWIERMYASGFQYIIFNLYFWSYFLPRVFLGYIWKKNFKAIKTALLAVFAGYIKNPYSKKDVSSNILRRVGNLSSKRNRV